MGESACAAAVGAAVQIHIGTPLSRVMLGPGASLSLYSLANRGFRIEKRREPGQKKA